MASNTENLNLLMKNPSTDGADTFNVQTMLNENWQKIDKNAGTVAQTLANILKPTTPPLIGLPSSAAPNDMFNVLTHAGDLHVWRKTVTTAQEIPAKYELGELQAGSFQFVGSDFVTWEYGTPNVGDDGTVYLVSLGSSNVNYSSNLNDLRGKYCKPNQASGVFLANQVIFIPSDAVFTQSGSAKYISKYQPVIGTPKTPAGTTTTYPVSTNRNAYQEGDDAKPAGYTLGEVVTGSFSLGTTAGTQTYTYEAATSLDVGNDGTVSLQNPSSGSFGTMGGLSPGDNLSTIQTFILGKFVRCTGINTSYVSGAPDTKYPFNVVPSDIVYIPSNANVTKTSNVIYIDRYQPVTGYAAIPANTTIEYLGCLGDKARVQVVSYVGTGTYGSSNPNSLTFDFVPKIVVIQSPNENTNLASCIALNGSKSVVTHPGRGYASEFSWNKKTVSWYNPDGYQLNNSGWKYTAAAIG